MNISVLLDAQLVVVAKIIQENIQLHQKVAELEQHVKQLLASQEKAEA